MTFMIRCVFTLGVFACLCAYARAPETEAAAQGLIDAGAVGLSMALVDKNGIYWSESRGYADLAEASPMSIDTLMNIASISKTVTGASLMMLVEQGKLDLDRDVNDYLPFAVKHPDYPGSAITARQLLTHSSAIVDRDAIYFSETSYFPGADNPLSLGDFVRAYLSPAGEFYATENYAAYPPGTQRAYSNVAYGLAGYLVEVLAAEPLNRYSTEKIFQPLKMNSTGWMLSEIDRGQHARLYEWSDGKHTPVAWYGLATWPDGGVRTSVRDLGRFFAAMMNGGELDGIRILQEATVNAMFQPQFAAGQILEGIEEGENEKQAISWAYRTAPGGEVVAGHSGADPGVSTHAYFFPEIGRAAILLVNTSSENQTFQLAVRDMMRALLNAAMNNKDKK